MSEFASAAIVFLGSWLIVTIVLIGLFTSGGYDD